MLILALCFGLRIADVFLIRSDEWFGELILSKVVGLSIVIAYAIWSGHGLDRIGFRKTSFTSVIWIGFGLTAAVMAATFLVQFLFLRAQGADPNFSVGIQGFTLAQQAEGQNGFLPFTRILVFNLVNATMEESLFRGLLLTHLVVTMSRMRANVVQALLFGLWHIVWPLRAFYDGEMALGAAMSYGAGYMLVATMMGFAWGCFFIWFRSLWVGIFAHAFQNIALNVFQITTAAGASGLALFTTLEALVFVALLPLVFGLSKRWRG
ncbi:type II CAAX endopeptidase family protein [Hydrogenophaga sp. PAMC20947]|uniref:CPBP family intramembrane glutamic endopeptidase n=1 Tax=Hydrogenophaga sp. PAMC20947 TaxID=2565558 RepID=UPI0014474906|nr:type II CAAX endopeptidase family protein [Hydrogenophaga sp. PAMC20947]